MVQRTLFWSFSSARQMLVKLMLSQIKLKKNEKFLKMKNFKAEIEKRVLCNIKRKNSKLKSMRKNLQHDRVSLQKHFNSNASQEILIKSPKASFLQHKLPISLHERSIKLICHKVLQASVVIEQLIALWETLQLKLNYYNFADRRSKANKL